MAENPLEIVTISSRNPANDGGDTIVFEAADVANGNKYRSAGRETLLAYNTDVTETYTVTITGWPDDRGEPRVIERFIEAGETVAFELSPNEWRQESGDDNQGYVLVSADSDAVLFAVIRRPAR